MSSSITGINVIGSHSAANELLRCVVHLVGRFRATEHAERFAAVLVSDPCETLCRAGKRLIPSSSTQFTVFAHHRSSDPFQGLDVALTAIAAIESLPSRSSRFQSGLLFAVVYTNVVHIGTIP